MAGQGIECPVCHQQFQVLGVQHARGHGFPDLESFKVAFHLGFAMSVGRRAAVAKAMRGRGWGWDSGRMSNNQRGRKRSAESRAKMSEAAARRGLQQPRANPFAGTKGEWVLSEKADQEVYIRSSYEKRLLRALDLHPEVVELEVEPFSIPYEYAGVRYQYIPDFLISFVGDIKELWEVKPARFLSDPKNQAKIAALNAFASDHGMNAAVVTLADIERLEAWVFPRAVAGLALPPAE